MVWWIAIGVTVAALVVVVMAAAPLRGQVAELQRVADLAAERANRDKRHLQGRVESVQAAAAEVQQRAGEVQWRLARLRRSDVR